jgi:hypothetical protein
MKPFSFLIFKTSLFLFIVSLTSNSCQAQFGDLLKKAKEKVGLESADISGGLKQALEFGVDEAVSSLARENGYFDSPYKILVPEEAQKVVSTVSKVPGFQNVERDLIKKMNEAAELAVVKAGPIFLDAIKRMTFEDAMNILMGEKDAATRYLEGTSRVRLYDEFMPVIRGALDEVNAREYWASAVEVYNKVPFSRKLNPELDDHVNQMALEGVFSLVEKKEYQIRTDLSQRTTPLLKDVFAKQD